MEARSKILARLSPAAGVDVALAIVPNSSIWHMQGITVCNRGAAASFRVAICAKNAAPTVADYVYYDLPITANDTFMSTLEVDLETLDTVRVYSSSGDLTFILYGGYQ